MKNLLTGLLSATIALSLSMITANAIHPDKDIMQNEYLTLYVGQSEDNCGRYQLTTEKGNLPNISDDKKSLTYENFYSSYTTVFVNGKTYCFGDGKTITAPYYDTAQDACITVQQFGETEVTQTLRFADGMQTGHRDMLLVCYSVQNLSQENVLFGLRIMIDSQLDKDDKGTLTADNALLNFEKFYSSAIPSVWSVVSANGTVTAYGKVDTVPDSLIFADWSSLYDTKWNYHADAAKDIEDSAAALVWENRTLTAGETQTFSVYYGVKNLPSAKPEGSDDSVVSDSPSQHSNSPQTSTVSQLSVVLPDKETPVTGDNGGLTTVAAVGAVISLPVIAAFSCMRRKARFRQRNED